MRILAREVFKLMDKVPEKPYLKQTLDLVQARAVETSSKGLTLGFRGQHRGTLFSVVIPRVRSQVVQ